MEANCKHVVEARVSHINEIARNIRPSDREEMWASDGMTPGLGIFTSVSSSDEAYTVLSPKTNKPFAMFGAKAGTALCPVGTIWLLSTPEIDSWKIAFARQSKACVQDMLIRLGALSNYVDIRNTGSIAWLKWLGAEFEEAAPYGHLGKDFQKFILRSNCDVHAEQR